VDFLVAEICIAFEVFSDELGRVAAKPGHATRLVALEAQEETKHRGTNDVLLVELMHEDIRRLSRVSLR